MSDESQSRDVNGGVVRSKWRYDGTITLGHLLIMIGIIASGVSLYTTSVTKFSSHESRITALEKLAIGQSEYNKAALEIFNELKTSSAILKDREVREGKK